MKFTDKVPTEPGYYWAICKRGVRTRENMLGWKPAEMTLEEVLGGYSKEIVSFSGEHVFQHGVSDGRAKGPEWFVWGPEVEE